MTNILKLSGKMHRGVEQKRESLYAELLDAPSIAKWCRMTGAGGMNDLMNILDDASDDQVLGAADLTALFKAGAR